MINFFKKAYEIYHIICILGFSLFLWVVIMGIFVVAPLMWVLDNVECPF
jgi:hypothetical protein